MLLLLWMLLGAGLRLAGLDAKPPWVEEFNTIVWSLGNSFESVPLDRVISFQDLLAPLIPHHHATIGDTIRHVVSEERQPPLYFAVAHLWMQLFPTDGGLANLWAARALPAVVGILTIPTVYICSYWLFGSRTIAHLSAAMLAVSPYGVYIAQEARDYSLAIWLVIISLSCLVKACGWRSRLQKIPLWTIAMWIVVNVLAMLTNYLSGIALIAEGLVLAGLWLHQFRQAKYRNQEDCNAIVVRQPKFDPSWRRISLAIVGTVAGIAICWWLLRDYPANTTAWLDNSPYKSIELVNPIFQIIGAVITMMSLLLVEVSSLPPVAIFSTKPSDFNLAIIVASALLMLVFFVWAAPTLNRGIRIQLRSSIRNETAAILGFVAIAIGLYLLTPWLTGIDFTRGARYQFAYFPGIVMLIGLGLASCWERVPSIAKWVSGKQAVAIVLLMGLVSSAIVASGYGYHKYYRPDRLVPFIARSAPTPVLIATTHNTLIQVGEMMGLAWEIRRTDRTKQSANITFLLAHQFPRFCDRNCPSTQVLQEIVERISRPIDLWAINFHAPIVLPPTCEQDKKFTDGIYGYEYRLYHCQPLRDID